MTDHLPPMANPPAMSPLIWLALLAMGVLWAMILGLFSRWRGPAGPRWWPYRRFSGLLVYGALSGLAFGLILESFRVTGFFLSGQSVTLLAVAWITTLALTARLGPGTSEPTLPHFWAGGLVIGLALMTIGFAVWLLRDTYIGF